MRPGSWDTYKRGATILVPVLIGALYIGSRLAIRGYSAQTRDDRLSTQARLDNDLQAIAARASANVDRDRAAAAMASAAVRSSQVPHWGTRIAERQGEPEAVALDKTHVYWVHSGKGEIVRAPRAGGPSQVVATKQELDTARHARTLAVDNDAVYWVTSGTRKADHTDGTVLRVPKKGGEPSALATAQRRPNALAVGGGYVYWVTGGSKPKEGEERQPGGVWRVKASGGKVESLSTASDPCGLALDDAFVYWVERDATALTINKTKKTGWDTQAIVPLASRVACGIAVNATHLYWIDTTKDSLMRVTTAGEDLKLVARLSTKLSSFALGPAFLIGVTDRRPDSLSGAGGIFRVPLSGDGDRVLLSDDQVGVNDVVLDGRDVFFTLWNEADLDGAVVRGDATVGTALEVPAPE